jgi:hypothetical protein
VPATTTRSSSVSVDLLAGLVPTHAVVGSRCRRECRSSRLVFASLRVCTRRLPRGICCYHAFYLYIVRIYYVSTFSKAGSIRI